jgi:hypothetical protein
LALRTSNMVVILLIYEIRCESFISIFKLTIYQVGLEVVAKRDATP